MNNAIKRDKVFTLIALYYRKKKTEKRKAASLSNYSIVIMYFLKTCLVILKTVFLFRDNYMAMTYFTQVDTRPVSYTFYTR